ncbi:glycosyltransferase, partial [candidate division TA06 bacterium]|nr:glycosyltransferase [candidate division TA06 bacterium]
VLPSLAEGLPNALLEAQACGLASVVTRVGGNSEIVSHGENGLVVEAGDASGLASALTTLIDDPASRATMGRSLISEP